MTQDEAKKWFEENARSRLENNRGLFDTFISVYDDEREPYQYVLEFELYGCTRLGCDDCPTRTERGHCYAEYLSIMQNGHISYEGKEYNETEFEDLINNIL